MFGNSITGLINLLVTSDCMTISDTRNTFYKGQSYFQLVLSLKIISKIELVLSLGCPLFSPILLVNTSSKNCQQVEKQDIALSCPLSVCDRLVLSLQLCRISTSLISCPL